MNTPIIVLLFLFLNLLWAQERDYDKELDDQSEAVQELKRKIEEKRKKLRSEDNREKSASQTLQILEEEISLVERLIQQLNRSETMTSDQIAVLENNIHRKNNELEDLLNRYTNRAKYIYTRGSLSDLEKVLSSTSWRQAVYRVKYQKIVAGIDHKSKNRIRSLLIEIGSNKLDLETAQLRNANLNKERQLQIADFSTKRRNKKQELKKIRTSKTELAQYIKDKEEGVKQLEKLIDRIREDKDRADRLRIQRELLQTKSFSALKGQLPWPAMGQVISKFGREWNSELKTTTNNTGIDIKGQPGSPVTAVMGGIVTTITFIRGYGNIIIIDHGSGFFTIYSHITNIQTNMGNEVKGGDLIAYMGDSGSVNGAKLHFEIWGQDQKLDPEIWLVKK